MVDIREMKMAEVHSDRSSRIALEKDSFLGDLFWV